MPQIFSPFELYILSNWKFLIVYYFLYLSFLSSWFSSWSLFFCFRVHLATGESLYSLPPVLMVHYSHLIPLLATVGRLLGLQSQLVTLMSGSWSDQLDKSVSPYSSGNWSTDLVLFKSVIVLSSWLLSDSMLSLSSVWLVWCCSLLPHLSGGWPAGRCRWIPYSGFCHEDFNLTIGSIRDIKIHDNFYLWHFISCAVLIS